MGSVREYTPVKTSLGLLLVGLSYFGCESVLGIKPPEPSTEQGGSGGQGGSVSTGGVSGFGGDAGGTTVAGSPGAGGEPSASGKVAAGGQTGATGQSGPGGQAGVGGQGGQSGGGAQPGGGGGGDVPCGLGDIRCAEDEMTPEVCNESGEWVPNVSENSGQECPIFCSDGRCTECEGIDFQCNGNIRQECVDGHWQDRVLCDNYCLAGACQNPPSCNGDLECANGISCCRANEVMGGSFIRDYDGIDFADPGYPATVQSFVLDKFEVTVSRMRRFVAAYPQIVLHEGDGKAPHIDDDPGWQPEYSAQMPATADELIAQLECTDTTWLTSGLENEKLPINCVDFYVAYAFCIWDKGRLPTEAEWNYAAAGGSEQRQYPWVEPFTSNPPTADHAYYGQVSGLPIAVGSKPLGDGRWGHSDLAGNVLEWTLDFYADYPETCDNCVNTTPAGTRAVRGAAYVSPGELLLVALRWDALADEPRKDLGLRCVHDIQ